MDYIASLIGVSTEQMQTFIGAALLVIVIGLILRFAWKFLIIGAVAVIVIAFVHERMQQMPVPVTSPRPPILASAPDAPETLPPRGGMTFEERDFLDKCVAEGENNRQECVDLWAEKLYADQGEKAGRQPASSAAN